MTGFFFEEISWSIRPKIRMQSSHMMIRFLIFALSTSLPAWSQSSPQAAGKPSTVVAVTQNRDKAVYDWAARHQEVLNLGKQGAVDIAVLGDSIMHYWAGSPKAPIVRGEASWNELFQGKKVANLGFGWDRVENVLWRVQNNELKELKPSTVIILIGTNNLEFNRAAEIRMGIQTLCSSIHKQLPEATIHVLGILPRTLHAKLITKPQEVNSELHQHLAGVQRVHFHDLSAIFLDEEGKLNGKLFSDGLHPNQEGYQRLGKAMRQIIAR